MKYYSYNIIIIIISIVIGSEDSNLNSIIGKKLNYELKFKNISAGTAYILIEKDSLADKSIIRLRSELKTNSFFDLFYKIRDDITVYMNDYDYSLIKVINKINEGKHSKELTSIVDADLKLISSSINNLSISKKVYSPLSVIFSLRNKMFSNDANYNYLTYSMGKLKNINVVISEEEIITTPYGTYNTFIAVPKSLENKPILKNNGDMKIWYTSNKDRIPIKIEIKINYGSILLKLKNIEE